MRVRVRVRRKPVLETQPTSKIFYCRSYPESISLNSASIFVNNPPSVLFIPCMSNAFEPFSFCIRSYKIKIVVSSGMIILGPRLGRYEKGNEKYFRPSNYTNLVLGTFFLWWGWLGFNGGAGGVMSGCK